MPGGNGNYGTSPLAPAIKDANLTVGSLTRHWTPLTTGTGAQYAWGGNNFTATTFAAAVTANEFVTFTLSANTGYTLSLSSIGEYNIRRSNTGPSTGQWQYAIGAGGFTDLGSPITWGTVTSNVGNPQAAIDLSSISAIQNVAAATVVTFRLVVWGASATAGTFYFNDAAQAGTLGLPIFGTVYESSAPIPVATPVILPTGGNVTSPVEVSITCATADATIYYTTNGANPTTSSSVYSTPFTVSETTTVKAFATKAGMENSAVASVTYTFTVEQTPIVKWSFYEMPGGAGNYGTSPLAPVIKDANLTVGPLTRHWTPLTTGSGAQYAWGGNNFTATTFAAAVAANEFVTFTLSANTGYSLSLSSIGTYNIRRSATGPSTGQWQYAIGAGGFTDIGSPITWGGVTSNVGNPQAAIDLSSISAIQNVVAGTVVTFRLVVWGATGTGGTFYFNDASQANTPGLPVFGAVLESGAPIPVATPVISPSGGTVTSPVEVSMTCATANATIYYTTNGANPTTSSSVYSTPFTVSETTTVKAFATKADSPNSAVASATYTFPVNVPNIAAFKAATTVTSPIVYKITGDVTFVHLVGRYFYIKDATGGLLIYDFATPVITKTYTNGDVISGGVLGTCTVYNGLYELIPLADLAVGTPGTPVQPITLTMATLLADFATYESQLVKLEEVEFDDGTFGTGTAANLNISQNSSQMVCRNHFGTLTGVATIATTRYNVTGFPIPYNADRQLAPRDANDVQRIECVITLNASPAAGGTPTGGGTYYYGDQVTVNANTNIAYNFINWTEGGSPVTTTQQYQFTATASRTLTANYQMKTYTITSSAGANGTIDPLGTTTVNYGTSKTYTITPNPGYAIDQVMVDGVNNTPAVTSGTYTFNNVTANHTISVTFKYKQYTLTLDPSTGTCTTTSLPVTYNTMIGSIPNATQSGCAFVGWYISSTLISTSYIWNFTENKTAIAKFNYPIIATNLNSAFGTISNPGTTNYNLGDAATYVCTPNTGYHIVTVVVDGSTVFTGNNETTAPYSHNFTNIGAAHTIVVSYAANCYALNPGNTIGTGATVTMSPAGCVPHGSNVTFTFSSNCADITAIKVGGVSLNPPYTTHTITNVTTSLPIIEITTVEQEFSIMATPLAGTDPMGEITPAGLSPVTCGTTVTYHFVTELGYRVKTLLVDDVSVPVPLSKSYTFTNVHANHTIHVEFEEFPYYIIQFGPSAGQNQGGIVFPDYEPDAQYYVAVDSGIVAYPFTITPDAGFVIDKVYVDNTVNTQAALTGTYTFTNVLTNHTIYATFKPIMFTITATAGANGSITPNGAVPVAYNADETFYTTANTGYALDKIFVDGVEDATASVTGFYTFEKVMANHTISATFVKKSYQITTIAGPQGTINPMNPLALHGTNQTFNFYPSTGYAIDKVLVDGVNIGAPNSYTFVNVTQEHTLQVIFATAKFTITATHQGGGVESFITPSGVATVEYDAHSDIYVFVSAIGYHIQKVLIDGINDPLAAEDGMYRFMNVKDNHTIHVIFTKDNFTIVSSASEGGAISPAGTAIVPNGSSKTYFFQASLGYKLARVLINGINNEGAVALGTYTFENVSEDHTIEAQFEKAFYNVIYEEVLGAIVVPIDGSVSPVGYGGKYKFKVEILEGYSQSDITVRANNLIINPSGDYYLLNNIAADQIITISGVALNQYKITAKAYNGGTITPAGTFVVAHGDNLTFEVAPNADYKISDVLVNGVSVGAVTSYLFNDIRTDGKIEAYFDLNNAGINVNDLSTINVFSHQNVVTIMNENQIPVKQVEIIDMYGRVIWTGPAADRQTNITLNVAKGIYAVSIITHDNNSITTKVVIN